MLRLAAPRLDAAKFAQNPTAWSSAIVPIGRGNARTFFDLSGNPVARPSGRTSSPLTRQVAPRRTPAWEAGKEDLRQFKGCLRRNSQPALCDRIGRRSMAQE